MSHSDLFPTPTRLALLREVAAGNVMEVVTEETEGHTWLLPVEVDEKPRKVCARIDEMLRAGWVIQDEAFWRITHTGRAVLDGAP